MIGVDKGEKRLSSENSRTQRRFPSFYLSQSGGKKQPKNYATNALAPLSGLRGLRPSSNAGAKVGFLFWKN
jgi:hypothetical protein